MPGYGQPQQPGYGQPAPGQPLPGYPVPPGYGLPAQPGRPGGGNRLWWVFGSGGVVLVIAAIVLVVTLGGSGSGGSGSGGTGGSASGGSGYSSPTQLANAYVDVLNRKSSGRTGMFCPGALPTGSSVETGGPTSMPYGATFSASLQGSPTVNGDSATADIEISSSYAGQSINGTVELNMAKQSGGWCFTGVPEASSGN